LSLHSTYKNKLKPKEIKNHSSLTLSPLTKLALNKSKAYTLPKTQGTSSESAKATGATNSLSPTLIFSL
jgi:hypothetical protein